jgi:hypothetical protein
MHALQEIAKALRPAEPNVQETPELVMESGAVGDLRLA